MLELPEILTVSKQLRDTLTGKKITYVLPPTKQNKFCWFNGDPASYDKKLSQSTVCGAQGFGIFAEILFDNGYKLCFNDGVNARFFSSRELSAQTFKDHQLLIGFADGSVLTFTIVMYGGIIAHDGTYDNEYYLKSRKYLLPFSSAQDADSAAPAEGFAAHYYALLAQNKPSLSTKAFLATEQRFPGIGNGVLQDILFKARINPRRKIGALSQEEQEILLQAAAAVLYDMTRLGGRDTEKDIFGNAGGYRTLMSRNSLAAGCPVCGHAITKENFLGGTVYYCPECQK